MLCTQAHHFGGVCGRERQIKTEEECQHIQTLANIIMLNENIKYFFFKFLCFDGVSVWCDLLWLAIKTSLISIPAS